MEINKPDIEKLLLSEDKNGSVIELDNYICSLCNWSEEIDILTEPQKNFYFNQELEREVNNGGFYQYFLNSSGSFAYETINSLLSIGANRTAIKLQRAIDLFPGVVPKDRVERQKALEKMGDSATEMWEELDQEFFVYEDDLNSLNLEYVRNNIDKF